MKMWSGSSWLRTGSIAEFWERGDEPSDPIKEFLHQVSDYQLPKKEPMPWCY
jgi:hypothetical protein